MCILVNLCRLMTYMKVRFSFLYGKFVALVLLLFTISTYEIYAQKDSVHPSMSMDLGITRGKNIYLWPVFRKIKTQDISQVQVLFPLFESSRKFSDSSSHNHLFPLYCKNSKKNHSDFRLISTYYPSLIHSWRDSTMRTFSFLEFVPNVNLFELSKSPDGLNVQNNFFFFIWQKNNRILDKSYFVVFPFSWYFHNKAESSYTLFPLFTRGNTYEKKYFAVSPLFWHTQNSFKTTNTLFPIVWNSKRFTKTDTIRSTTIFPAYWSKKGDLDNYSVLFPVFWKFNNKQDKHLTIFPLYFSGKSNFNNRSYLGLTPFFWKFKSESRKSTVLIPFFWDAKTAKSHSFTLLPLVSYGSDFTTHNSHLVITPFFWKLKQKNLNTTTVFPVWWYKRSYTNSDTIITKTFFPLWWDYKDRFNTNKILVPFLWSFKGPEYTSFTLFPLWSKGQAADKSNNHLCITPLFWHLGSKSAVSNTLFPLWWNRKIFLKNDTLLSNVLFPLWWSHSEKLYNYRVFFPFAWQIDNPKYSSVTVFPFFSIGKAKNFYYHHLVVTPFFWQFRNSRGYRDVLFPLIWLSSTISSDDIIYSKLILPFWWSRSDKFKSSKLLFPVWWSSCGYDFNNKVLFPFVWSLRNSNYKSLTIMPFFSSGKSPDSLRSHFMLTPFFYHSTSPQKIVNTLFPLWWYTKIFSANDTIVTSNIFPVFWSKRSNTLSRKIIFPIYFNNKTPEYHSISVLPLFSAGWSPDFKKSHLVVTPLFYRVKSPENTINVLIPIWSHSKTISGNDTLNSSVIFPFWWSQRSRNNVNYTLIPLMWYNRNSEFRSLTIVPFFSTKSYFKKPDKQLFIAPAYWSEHNASGSLSIFFPVYWHQLKFWGKDTVRSTTVFPIYWGEKSKKSSWNVYFPIVWNFRTPTYRSFSILPFYSFGSSTDRNYSHLMITPFYHHFVKPDKISRQILPIWWNSRKIAHNDTIRSNVIFPLWWSKQSNRSRYSVLFPLYYRLIRNDKADFSKSTYIFPVFWSKSGRDKELWTFFPLIWRIKNSNYSSFTFAPLFSSGHSLSISSNYLMITPFYYNFKNQTGRNTGIFPIFSFNKRLNELHYSFLLVLLRGSKGPQKSSFSMLWPLIDRTKDLSAVSFRIAPFVWYKKSAAFKYFSIQPFWYQYSSKTERNRYLLWQLLVFKNELNVCKSTNFLWKTIFSDRYNNGDHEFRLLYLVFADVKKNGEVEKSLFPIYHSVKKNSGDRSLSLFFYFYTRFSQKIPEINDYYQEERIFWFMRLRSNYKQLKQQGKDKYLKRHS